MATTTFGKRLDQAATDLSGESTSCVTSTAWVQYKVDADRSVKVRMQAPEIMKEFSGSVDFGTDPKGILFFSNVGDLNIVGTIKVRNAMYPVSGTTVVVETEFGSPGGPEQFDVFARFVAEVDTTTYKLPDTFTSAVGEGELKDFDAVTCHFKASRATKSATVSLGSKSIQKQVYFTSDIKTSTIDQSGVMFFTLLRLLKTQPNDSDSCMADYNKERILYYIDNPKKDFVALFLPNKPMERIGEGIKKVTWKDT